MHILLKQPKLYFIQVFMICVFYANETLIRVKRILQRFLIILLLQLKNASFLTMLFHNVP